jgi:hypothetical protein
MKKYYIIFALYTFAFFTEAKAQAPQKISYQAVIRNGSDALMSNTQIGMRISILQGNEFGAAVYVETHKAITNKNGLVTLEIGGGARVAGSMNIAWSSALHYIKIETDINGAANYTLSSTQQLLSVPYALYAENSGSSGSVGPVGPQGPKGDKGDAGVQGLKGDQGDQGPKGDQGLQGIPGTKGDKGDVGAKGNDGTGVNIIGSVPNVASLPSTASKGDMVIIQTDGNGHVWDGTRWVNVGQIKGPKGDKGDKGDNGNLGLTGALGPKGDKGDPGIQGPKGDKGENGAQGTQGIPGKIQSMTGTDGVAISSPDGGNTINVGLPINAINPNRLAGGGASNGQILQWNGSAWTPQNNSSGGSGVWTQSGNNINNTNSGNVGISTNTPIAKLEISTPSSFTQPILSLKREGIPGTSDAGGRLDMTAANINAVNQIRSLGIQTDGGSLSIGNSSANGQVNTRIYGSTRIQSPDGAKLELHNQNVEKIAQLDFVQPSFGGAVPSKWSINANPSTDLDSAFMSFGYSNPGVISTAMSIVNNGNIGIGMKPFPLSFSKLQIKSKGIDIYNNADWRTVYLLHDSNGNPSFDINNGSGTNKIKFGVFNNSPSMEFKASTGATIAKLGSTNDRGSFLLTNNGDTKINLLVNNAGRGLISGDEFYSSYLEVSDLAKNKNLALFKNEGGFGQIQTDNGSVKTDLGGEIDPLIDKAVGVQLDTAYGYVGTNNFHGFTIRTNATRRIDITREGDVTVRNNLNISNTLNVSKGINAFGGVAQTIQSYGFLNKTNPVGLSSGTGNFSLFATNRIAASEFNAHSDQRIKNVLKSSDPFNSLALIAKLPIQDYQYKDIVNHPSSTITGLIAHEVKEILPGAISKSKNIIPNIYCLSKELKNEKGDLKIVVDKVLDIKSGDKIRIVLEDEISELMVKNTIDSHSFTVTMPQNIPDLSKPIFIYGKEVDDFLSVDYNQIMMLGISSIQALIKENNELKSSVQEMKADIGNIMKQLNMVDANQISKN